MSIAEVKRNANVGELVRVVGACAPYYRKGDIGKFVGGSFNVNFTGHGNAEVCGDGKWAVDSYVVLEPTDIIHVDGVRYREEKRAATVGERILIVAAEQTGGEYNNGSVLTVKGTLGEFDCVYVNGHDLIIYDREYVVLTPLRENITGSYELPTNNITLNLNITVASSSPSEILKAIADSVQAELAKFKGAPNDKESRGKITEVLTNKSPQQIRDGIVEQAKADVEELTRIDHRAEFVVNREKRTVVALIRKCGSLTISARGIAKCSPDDCFNAHIGKAIALHRALGLDVPSDYLKAPQPTEPRVGDVVLVTESGAITGSTMTVTRMEPELDEFGYGKAFSHTHDPGWLGSDQVSVIDDSRDQETEVPAVA
ncbi:hypothetical protein EEL30_15710 [Brevibacillus laterosporus]|uniref:Uncharacterized protein n=1 Tax=Brevibacillus laterosporus TaxID=1465 RepID=A0A518V9H4_BRELA|nr:hypothetical protein EEL30_15710 [Brevibacillus laterosporus]